MRMSMFQKTRLRLVAINSLIVFFVLISLGGTAYFYLDYSTFARLDHDLLEAVQHEQRVAYAALLQKPSHDVDRDHRVVYLLWDQDEQLVAQIPRQVFSPAEIEQFKTSLGQEGVHTLAIKRSFYRNLVVPYGDSDSPSSGARVFKLEAIQNIDPEKNMLSSMLAVLLLGGLVGVAVSFLVGYLLAQKALVPIRQSWNKQHRFVADASHELRTPLTVVQANLELLFRHPEETVEHESVKIHTALNEVKRMNKLVAELLTLARSDSGEPEFSFQPFHFDVMLKDIAGQFLQLAQAKNICLEMQVETGIEAIGDEDRLRQVVVILLDNALKYTPAHGEISLTCRKQKQRVEVKVKDTGVGIAEEDLPHIFDRFYRSDKARRRSERGTGLGLSIAQWIVAGHAGSLRVESKLGQGATFSFSMPIRPRRG